MNEEELDRRFVNAMSSVKGIWGEEDIIAELRRNPETNMLATQLLLIGILGSKEAVIAKYPEIFI
jgi:hypothetical protein